MLISSKLTNVEATAALARMRRAGRSDDRSNLERTSSWERLWGAIGAVAVDALVIERALGVARSHGLRGYDAVQLASALCVDGRPAFLSFGVELNAAARAEGLTVLGPLA